MMLVGVGVFYSLTDDPQTPVADNENADRTVVMINGRAFEPNFIDEGKDGRMIVVVEEEDLYDGENTVEIHWGEKPPASMTAGAE